ncbi:MAG TPA: 30S ribosomal protein S12 methylthiotransferase RimO [Flavobacteriales bacterium]|nr:30S ribosomal protein S12 methylthiotransferase RimO [Crocinitomicaceae bacterium]HAE30629.1 30S ribosomal protein S12 methylthiotransferase RimO [Flavobacteriales bacterium]
MKTKTLRKNRVNVITLGCSKNIFDSEVMMAQLKANHFDVVHESASQDAEIVIINTCGFIESAKEESVNAILEYAEAKKTGGLEKLYVTGCLSQRYGSELSKEIPEVDSFFGTRELPKLLKTLKADYKKELVGERLLTTPAHYAYFKIAEGCDRPCSFCAIPLMRGKHRSKPIEELVDSAKQLVQSGTKELILIAQDLTYYGLDLYGKRNLSELLKHLSDIKGLEWIRLHYAYPSGFPKDILKVMADRENICNYLDIPLQHGSTEILKSMRRGITREKTSQLLMDIREQVPNIAIRTTLITGYPGEKEEHFEEMKEWVMDSQFDRLGCFTYSHEENTHAFNLKDDVPSEIKKARAEEIMNIQADISFRKNQSMVGKVYRVLIDKEEGGYYVGRTEFDSPEVDNEVLINASKNQLKIGNFVDVKIEKADFYDLFGNPIPQK